MAEFFSYLRNITYYLVFAAVVNMAAPNGKYQRYVRLVTGLILVAILFTPLTSLLHNGLPATPVTDLFANLIPVSGTSTLGAAIPGTTIPGTTIPGTVTASAANGGTAAYLEQQQYEAVQAAFEDQLRRQLSGLLTQNDCTLQDASFDYAPDFSELYYVHVTAAVSAKPKSRSFIYIEPVRIPAIGVNTNIDAAKTDRMQTDRMQTDGIETDGIETDGIETDGIETDGIETDGIETDDAETDDHVRAIKKWIGDFYNLSPEHIDVRVIYE